MSKYVHDPLILARPGVHERAGKVVRTTAQAQTTQHSHAPRRTSHEVRQVFEVQVLHLKLTFITR